MMSAFSLSLVGRWWWWWWWWYPERIPTERIPIGIRSVGILGVCRHHPHHYHRQSSSSSSHPKVKHPIHGVGKTLGLPFYCSRLVALRREERFDRSHLSKSEPFTSCFYLPLVSFSYLIAPIFQSCFHLSLMSFLFDCSHLSKRTFSLKTDFFIFVLSSDWPM